MMNDGALQPTETLGAAVEIGVRARDKKALGDARKKKGKIDEEETAKGILEISKARLMGLLEVVEMAAGLPPRSTQRLAVPPNASQAPSSPLSSAISLSSDSDAEYEDKVNV